MMNLEEKINPVNTALIVIDIQNDMANPDPKYFRASRGGDFSLIDPMIDNLEKVIPVAERAGVFVAYSKQVYDPSKLNCLQRE